MSDQHHFDHSCDWCVELLTEWGAAETLGGQRMSLPSWEDSAFECDGEEMRALKTCLARLQSEHPAEHAAVVNEFRARRRAPAQLGDRAVLNTAIKRLAAWVDAEMGDDE